jgi:hypothetical protein
MSEPTPYPRSRVAPRFNDRTAVGGLLACPEPGCRELGIDRCGGDDFSVTLHPDRDEYDSPAGTRGGYVRIDYHCPSDHQFSLIIGNQKGAEILSMVSRDHCDACDRQYANRPTAGDRPDPADPFA